MNFLAEILVKRGTLTKAGLLVSRKAVLIPKARRRVGLVLVVPIMRHLLIMLAELDIVLVLSLVVSLASILRNRNGCGRQYQDRDYI
jgi:hypothetical protein